MSPYAPRRQVLLAVPVHTMAGVNGPRMGGLLDEVLGGVFSLFKGDPVEKQLKVQRQIAQDQLNQATAIAKMQAEMGNKAIDASVQTERIRASNELAAIDAAYAAQLTSQRVKRGMASEALSAQLLAQAQSGVLGLSRSGLEQAGSLSRSYPRSASTMLAVMVLGTGFALVMMGRKSGGKKRKGGGRRARRSLPPMSSPPVPSYSYAPAAA